MDERTLRTLVEMGAVRRVRIVADGARFRVEVDTPTGTVVATTLKGAPKTWTKLDSAARWVQSLGLGTAQLELAAWRPGQRELAL